MPLKAKLYLAVTILAGGACVWAGTNVWTSQDPLRFVCFFALTLLSSGLKVSLPGVAGTMSVNFLFMLVCLSTLSLPETLVIACAATVGQCFYKSKTRPRLVRILFNVASVAIAITIAYHVFTWPLGPKWGVGKNLMLALAAHAYFAANTFPVALAICLTEGKQIKTVWQEFYFWSYPYYLVGAAVAAVIGMSNGLIGWQASMLIFPVMFILYRSYREYLTRLEKEKKQAEDMAALHLRTIQALAVAIEAKDHTSHSHLRRVAVYSREIGKEVGLSEDDLQALWAGALLLDIGKLAVPEHILSKPGRLTTAEFEKMKIHPTVGAEILEQVEFPYPVAPIVRAHHEKWNGAGYPSGLKGDEIPMGARILAAVDCLDALVCDRPYRPAVNLDEAMAIVVSESGKSYDPRVVEILQQRYLDLEKMVHEEAESHPRIAKNVRVLHRAPAAVEPGNLAVAKLAPEPPDFLSSIAAAREEAQQVFELAHELGNSLNLTETLSLLALRLKRLCPYDSIAIYVRRGETLAAEFSSGQDFALFSSLAIPMGEGISGWVAENKKPIINGNPSVEPGYLGDPSKFSTLQSALAVPLEGLSGVVGVLSLYSAASEAFTPDHARILMAVSTKIALSVENALKYMQAESCATTDALTGLPNARSLFLHLDSELARCKRSGDPLTVLVCDLDGFKQVNDRFGHLEGNKVLRMVAQGFRECCRDYDYAARMGGDEFVLMLPAYEGAIQSTIERLNDIVVETGWNLFGEQLLSLSVGEATYPADGVDAEQLLAKGDHRMYKAKQESKTRALEESRTKNVVVMNLARHLSSDSPSRTPNLV